MNVIDFVDWIILYAKSDMLVLSLEIADVSAATSRLGPSHLGRKRTNSNPIAATPVAAP
jgi:hypothetical protein